MALGNGLDNASHDGFIRDLAGRPMTDRSPRALRGLTGNGHDLTPLLGAKGGGGTGTWIVLQALKHGAFGPLQPVSPPASDRQAAGAQGVGDITSIVAIGELQNDLGSETDVLRRLMGAGEAY